MNKASYPLKLPTSVKMAAERLAREDGVSLNQWISVAIAEKIGVVETVSDFSGAGRAMRSRRTCSPISTQRRTSRPRPGMRVERRFDRARWLGSWV
ncbi:hypothetical protein [Rhizorhabdus dicambivorans]|uniref:hypothetical protein n=1 Tax=Rhizorhabdus dicambivorans TaxID=1850238 RepID=UPI000A4A319B|nr:hypothetical protein [Rhizorhabdus dicambivorans]